MSALPFPLPDVEWEPLRPFWAGAAAGELRLPHCDGCGRIHWYPVGRCRRCGIAEPGHDWRAVAGTGALHSWTVVRHAFLPELAGLVPFVSALVALDVDPDVRLVTRLVDCDEAGLAIDDRLEVTFRPMRFPGVEGQVAAPFFRPAG
jgi:uncharacterized protein